MSGDGDVDRTHSSPQAPSAFARPDKASRMDIDRVPRQDAGKELRQRQAFSLRTPSTSTKMAIKARGAGPRRNRASEERAQCGRSGQELVTGSSAQFRLGGRWARPATPARRTSNRRSRAGVGCGESSEPHRKCRIRAPAGGLSAWKQLPLALIVTASNTENDMSYGSGAEARL